MLEFTRINTKEDHDGDIEQGTLYPGLSHGENVLRWGFIRKVYDILAAQMVLTTAVSFLTVLYAPINDLLRGNSGLLMFLVFLPFVREKRFEEVRRHGLMSTSRRSLANLF
ncbi:hypothetical protein HanPI659440_Chr11g0428371 [Helianthus annuus]|nr:hypothetical protein HanPI659440_Chr11g0428371 [Helianthus annuus]